MPPRDGVSIAQFLTVADIELSARYYEKVFNASLAWVTATRLGPSCWRIYG